MSTSAAGMGNAGLDEENKFPCDLCEKSYVEKCSLMKHIRWKHKSPSPKLTCSICTVTFSYKLINWVDKLFEYICK